MRPLRVTLAAVAAVCLTATVGVALTACSKQQDKHQDESIQEYALLNSQTMARLQQNPQSAFEFLDSLEQKDEYPTEIINVIRGSIYLNSAEYKTSESCFRKALNENLHELWPFGYYNAAYTLCHIMNQRDNVEGAMRVATESLNRLTGETDPELEVCKWNLMTSVGIGHLRLRQLDESEKILDKTYEDLKASTLKHKDEKRALAMGALCLNVLGHYMIFIPDKIPLWLDRTEEVINISEQINTSGNLTPKIAYFKAKLLSNKAQYLGSVGKLKEAKEAFDAYMATDFANLPDAIIEKFNYYYFSKQWSEAANFLRPITDLHYKTMKVEPTLTSLCDLGLSFRVYENAGRYDDAAEMGRMMANLVDSVRYYHTKDQAAEMAALFETKEKDAEIAQQQIELSQQRLIGLATCIVLLTLFFIVYTLLRKRAAKRLAEVKAAQERIENELRIARDIQMSMLPNVFPEREGLDMYALMNPAKEVGGDLYGYLLLGDKLYFALGDVSGKGIPSSLFMAQATRLFLTLAKQGIMPAEICTRMNDALSGDDNENSMFVTFWLGMLDLQTGHLDFCNAGHNPPVIGGGDHQGDFLKMVPNLPIGFLPGFEYVGESIDTIKGRALFIYTDGLNEAENLEHQQFGDDRLLDILRNTHFDTAQQVIETLKAEVEAHRDGAEPNDDLTMMCLRVS